MSTTNKPPARLTPEEFDDLVERSSASYSFDRYTNWPAVVRMLLRRGYDARQTEAILRSKWTRWACDGSSNTYGRCTSRDLTRFLDLGRDTYTNDAAVAELVAGTFAS